MYSIVRLFGGTVLVFVALVTAPSASAATGWYLLVPPSSDFNEHAEYLQGFKILDTKPLSQWWQQGAYDSASECEAAKNTLLMTEHIFYSKLDENYIKAIGENKDSAVLKHMRYTAERANANVDTWTASHCIKSNDPRLGK
jgi:hypothetical protein